jgi:hypothetical protein
LDREAPRTMAVYDPVLLQIVNLEEIKEKDLEAALFPIDKSKGMQKYTISEFIYIDSEDFSEE